MQLEAFLDDLSSNSPAPGGGAAAALSGALGAALDSMVASITAKKKPEFEEYGRKAREFRDDLVRLMEKDSQAFLALMAAWKAKDEAALAEAAKDAAGVPLSTAEKCLSVMALAAELLEKGSKNVITDSAGAGYLGYAGVQSALLNTRINLPVVKDVPLKQFLTEKAAVYARKADSLLKEIQERIEAHFAARV